MLKECFKPSVSSTGGKNDMDQDTWNQSFLECIPFSVKLHHMRFRVFNCLRLPMPDSPKFVSSLHPAKSRNLRFGRFETASTPVSSA